MAEFSKSHYRSVDAKRRFMLPVEYREALALHSPSASFVLTGFYGRLVAYTIEVWKQNSTQLTSIKNPSLPLSRFISKVLGLAEEVTPDAQGRVRLTQPLMREAGMTKNIVLVGLNDKFEIWDQNRFEALELEDVSADLAARGVDISL